MGDCRRWGPGGGVEAGGISAEVFACIARWPVGRVPDGTDFLGAADMPCLFLVLGGATTNDLLRIS